jgi:hypothetical protein
VQRAQSRLADLRQKLANAGAALTRFVQGGALRSATTAEALRDARAEQARLEDEKQLLENQLNEASAESVAAETLAKKQEAHDSAKEALRLQRELEREAASIATEAANLHKRQVAYQETARAWSSHRASACKLSAQTGEQPPELDALHSGDAYPRMLARVALWRAGVRPLLSPDGHAIRPEFSPWSPMGTLKELVELARSHFAVKPIRELNERLSDQQLLDALMSDAYPAMVREVHAQRSAQHTSMVRATDEEEQQRALERKERRQRSGWGEAAG